MKKTLLICLIVLAVVILFAGYLFSFYNTLVVKDQAVLAVEAIEGTDEAIKRGGLLCGKGAVVIKVCKPHQDLRFDLPAIGPQTIASMLNVKAACLAIEAGKTIMLDRETLLREADRAGISIIAIQNEQGIS